VKVPEAGDNPSLGEPCDGFSLGRWSRVVLACVASGTGRMLRHANPPTAQMRCV